eukprot:scaffold6371_cov110-Isochrysis_galbana.AAC.5
MQWCYCTRSDALTLDLALCVLSFGRRRRARTSEAIVGRRLVPATGTARLAKHSVNLWLGFYASAPDNRRQPNPPFFSTEPLGLILGSGFVCFIVAIDNDLSCLVTLSCRADGAATPLLRPADPLCCTLTEGVIERG